MVAAGYLVSDGRDFLVMQGLGHIYQLGGAVLFHRLVQLADVAYPYDVVETQVLVESLIHLLASDRDSRAGRVLAVDTQQQESLLVLLKREDVYQPGRRGERAVVAVKHPVEAVDRGVKLV